MIKHFHMDYAYALEAYWKVHQYLGYRYDSIHVSSTNPRHILANMY